ncbi:MAG: carbohydrate ABC transporter permease [Chloroflexota bacterium]
MSQTAENYPIVTKQNYLSDVPWYQRARTRRTIRLILLYICIIPGAIMFITPLIWMLSTSLKPSNQIFIYPPQWIPDPFQWSNFPESWLHPLLPFNTFFLNTLIITTNNVIGNLISCSLAAFAFARLRSRLSNIFFFMVLATMMIPNEVTMIPQFIIFSGWGWINTWLPLMVPAWFGFPFFIFLLRQFFMTIPRDLDEAARIDGASSWQILYKLIIPLSKPALATVAIFAFIGNWNNFFAPLVYIRDKDLQMLAVGLNMFRGQYGSVQFHLMMAAALVALLPVLIVFFFGQKYFVQGITLTGMKG